MIAEDASIVESKACQAESWIQSYRGSTEYWLVPACNFTGNLEIGLGGARIVEGQERTSAIVLQGKHVLRKLETNGWGLGVVLGNERRTSVGASATDNLYASTIASISLRDDRILLHTNLGVRRSSDDKRLTMTWGAAQEAQISERAWLTAEMFGENKGKPFYQIGARYWIIPDRVQIDASYGNRFGGDSDRRWVSFGLALFSSTFLP